MLYALFRLYEYALRKEVFYLVSWGVSDNQLWARSKVTKKSQFMSPNNLAPVESSKNSE